MKKLYIAFSAFLVSTALFAQHTNVQPKLSANTQQYLWRIDHEHGGNPTVMPEYVYKMDASHNVYVSALIKVQAGFNASALTPLGVKIGTKAGNVWTAQIPLNNVRSFTHLSGIQCIDLDQPAFATLDTARVLTRVDSVQAGYGLPQPYSGHNVVVGIVDAGFDYTHPTFYDTAYQAYRIKRVWEEKNITGTPPSGYSYGTEYSDSLSIITKAHDITSGTHGTHVSGIAAGSGFGSTGDKRFRGMSYNSDIVMVGIYPTAAYWLNTGMTDMLDGIHYVFDYAGSVGKPAVANLSWGCPLGPHDGTSLFSQACDAITGPGEIFVLSGGNNGTDRIHLQKTFTTSDTLLASIATFASTLTVKKNQFDIWGETGKTFNLSFSLYYGTTKIDSTMRLSLDDQTHSLYMIGTSLDTVFLTVTTVSSEFNGKPHMLIQAYSKVNDRLCINITGTDGTVNVWQGFVLNTTGYYGAFNKYTFTFASNGDSQMTVSDMVTTQSAIGVAAYNSKPSFVNVSGASLTYSGYPKGAIASFSSKGPTVDGRTKPNIAGPGMAVASAVSSVDTTFYPSGDSYNSVVSTYVSPLNGTTYSYAMEAGTSMSGPAVSGIVGLLLEAAPTLSPTDVMTILSNTAIRDSYTGTITAAGSNTWGWGKVNAYHAMLEVLGMTTGIHHEETNLNCILYPNPNAGNYNIEYVGGFNESLQVKVMDARGQLLINQKWTVQPGSNHFQVDLSNYAQGIYFTEISGKSGRTTVKIVKQ